MPYTLYTSPKSCFGIVLRWLEANEAFAGESPHQQVHEPFSSSRVVLRGRAYLQLQGRGARKKQQLAHEGHAVSTPQSTHIQTATKLR